jgi:uncharacterized membrane protein
MSLRLIPQLQAQRRLMRCVGLLELQPQWDYDMSVFAKGLVTILICSAVFGLISLPLIFRKVPPNPVYGYRTRITLSDEALWYEVNAYFGLRFLLSSLLPACIAVALFEWHGLSPQAYLPVSVGLLLAPVVVAGLLTSRFARAIRGGRQPSNSDG